MNPKIMLTQAGLALEERRWRDIWENMTEDERKSYLNESGIKDMFMVGYELGVSDIYLKSLEKETVH
jgi:hypothetical protein